MTIGIYAAISGMDANERELEVCAHNLANAGTAGYKAQSLAFESMLAKFEQRKGPVSNTLSPFVSQGELLIDHTAGTMTRTENPMDLSIDGKGYFVINTPMGERYTRNGKFQLDKSGNVVTEDGSPVATITGNLTLGADAKNFLVGKDGTVTVNEQVIGKFRIVDIPDTRLLQPTGHNYFKIASGGSPIDAKHMQICQGAYEASNVNSVSELTKLIRITRASEAYQKSVMTYSRAQEKAASDIAKIG